MEIKVLGTGCPNCKKTKAVVDEAIKEMKLDVTVIEVHDIAVDHGLWRHEHAGHRDRRESGQRRARCRPRARS